MKTLCVGLAIGIAMLFPLLANMTVRFWAEPPEYGDFYPYYNENPKTAEERQVAEKEYRERNERYEQASAKFNQKAFYITFPMGIGALFLAYGLRRSATIAAGLLFGGFITISFGSYSCWETLPGWQRYVSLLFTLGVMTVLAVLIDRQTNRPARSPEDANT